MRICFAPFAPNIALVAAMLCVACGLARPALAEDPSAANAARTAEIARWVEQLNAPRFAERRQAETELLRLGLSALPALRMAQSSRSAEVRLRARKLVATIEYAQLAADFDRIGRLKEDADIDVEEAMWFVARVVDPTAKRVELKAQLDALADRVRDKLGRDVDPKTVEPPKAVEALRQALFVDYGLTGNVGNYDDPANSSVLHVLETKKGLPIILSEIVVAVGRRLKLPMEGLPWAGRYVVFYDGSQAPRGQPRVSIVLDPFASGKVLTNEEIMDRGIDPSDGFYPSPRRLTVARMLRNLSSAYRVTGDSQRSDLVDRYVELVGKVPKGYDDLEEP